MVFFIITERPEATPGGVYNLKTKKMSRGKHIPEIDNVYCTSVNHGKPIYFEYVSKYRRITVIGESSGFTVNVTYKNLDVKNWMTRWGDKSAALSWAKVYSENRCIKTGLLTIKEPVGTQVI